MRRPDWEERIAAEDPEAARHVAECAGCAAFKAGLRDALAELQGFHAEEIAPAHYAAVRARVLAELRPRRRWAWLWAVAGLMAVIAVVMVGERMRVEELRVAVGPQIPAVDLKAAQMPARRAGGSLHKKAKGAELLVRIESSDVVIYWIAEGED